MTRRRFCPTGLVGMLALAALTTVVPAQARSQADSGEKIFDRVIKSTAWVIALRPDGKAESGTGSLIDRKHRWVLTNFHVVDTRGASPKGDLVYVFFPHYSKSGELISERPHYTQLLARGGAIRGKVLFRDEKCDLALIELERVPSGVQPLKLAAKSVKAGQTVHSIGNPGKSGALWLYTQGVVRAVYHKKWGAKDGNTTYLFEAKVVETQSPTNPGDSGGPLVNKDGDLVAVTQGYNTNAQLLSLFIDVSEVKHFLNQHKLLAKISPAMARETQRAEKPGIEKPGDPAPAADAKTEKDAAVKLRLAKALADAGKIEKARESCQNIIKDYPKTEAATEAKLLLDKLEK